MGVPWFLAAEHLDRIRLASLSGTCGDVPKSPVMHCSPRSGCQQFVGWWFVIGPVRLCLCVWLGTSVVCLVKFRLLLIY